MITTEDCKRAIVEFIANNRGIVCREFTGNNGLDFELPALDAQNWKRISKRRVVSTTVRDFDCKPYGDQLRACVYECNGIITRVEVHGE